MVRPGRPFQAIDSILTSAPLVYRAESLSQAQRSRRHRGNLVSLDVCAEHEVAARVDMALPEG